MQISPRTHAILENTMTRPLSLALEGASPMAHFAKQIDVVAWLPSRVQA